MGFSDVPSHRLRQSATHMKLWESCLRPSALFSSPTGGGAAMDGEPVTAAADAATARLLEQLMQIARTSALEEMASGFAHEINQPIGAIATFAQAAERMLSRPEPMTAEALGVLRHISNEALNAGQGIRRIRKMFDDATMSRAVCTMNEVLAELMPVLELLTDRAGVHLEAAIDASLPPVAVDRLRIQHVLYTLVQNAIEVPRPDHCPARVRIEMNADRYAITTAVIDNGVGLSAEARTQLFRPFFTTKHQSTGLGLASSRAIIESHEGAIGCEDVAGGGAKFWFRLPAAST